MKNKHQKITVIWKDAVHYCRGDVSPGLPLVKTTGFVQEQAEEYLIIKNPVSHRLHSSANYFKEHEKEKKIAFLFIPMGMVQEIL
ncbi:MAG TPA: hypothetical protein VFM02_02105 [Candidatus Paceibacterota bacterium]|nr:hypothetical protein [Candidatus Paceibacterota bacterium]